MKSLESFIYKEKNVLTAHLLWQLRELNWLEQTIKLVSHGPADSGKLYMTIRGSYKGFNVYFALWETS